MEFYWKIHNILYCATCKSKIRKDRIDTFKTLYERIGNNKEELKIKIQDIFTRLRNDLNNRDEEILQEVETYFNDIYCNESLLKEIMDLPNKIQLSFEKRKKIEISDNNKLASIV